jgi:hypothetical protein
MAKDEGGKGRMAKGEGGKGRMAKGEGKSKNLIGDVFSRVECCAVRLELEFGRFGFPFAFRPLPFAKLFA